MLHLIRLLFFSSSRKKHFLKFKIFLSKNNNFLLTSRNIHDRIMSSTRKDLISMYTKSITHYIAKYTIDVLFYLSIICTIAVPLWAKILFAFIRYPNAGYLTPFTVILFLSGLCCVYILFHLKQMYRTLLIGNPFVEQNVSHLRKMAVACTIIALIYLVKCFFMFTFATLVIAGIFVVGCLFCLTLKDLFKQAINYKTENDLTI